MSYVGKVIDDGSVERPIGSTLYGTCSTPASTAAKVVTLPDFDRLITGVTIYVKFTYGNTATDPTLSVGSTSALSIKEKGTTAASEWDDGAVLSFTYDGTYWMMSGGASGGGAGGTIQWIDV